MDFTQQYPIIDTIQAQLSNLKNLDAPLMVSIDITNKCNLRCVHCFNNSGSAELYDSELNDEEIIDVAKQICDLKPTNVCLCGGETTCRKNILDIVDVLHEGEVGNISMVSNGMTMTKKKAAELNAHGVTQIQISLDGVNKYQHDTFRGVSGSFNNAVNAIKVVKELGLSPVTTSLVPNKLNFKDIYSYVEMCVGLGVEEIRIMPFIPSGRGKTLGRQLILSNYEYFILQSEIVRAQRDFINEVYVEWGDPIDHLRRMPTNAFNGLKTYCMEIKSNGDLTATTYLPVIVGSTRKHSLREYWDAGYDRLWKNPKILEYTEKIQNIYDFDTFEPAPFSGEKVYIDLI